MIFQIFLRLFLPRHFCLFNITKFSLSQTKNILNPLKSIKINLQKVVALCRTSLIVPARHFFTFFKFQQRHEKERRERIANEIV